MQRFDWPRADRYVVDEGPARGVPMRELFARGCRASTLFLSVIFFMAFGVLAIAVLWMPALLRAQGIGSADTAVVIGFHGLGALLGMAVAGRLIERFGGARVLLPAMIAGALATASAGHAGASIEAASVAVALIGVFVGIGASGAIALTVLLFPPHMRSSAVGWSMGMGRLGQVIAPLLTGTLVQHGYDTAQVLVIIACAPLIAASCVAAMRIARLLPSNALGDGSTVPAAH